MKIFGITFTTKKELKEINAELMDQLDSMLETFPFRLGQTVYDIALKNAQGRFTKTKPSFEQSTISEVTVDAKNYFKLVDRFNRKDVHMTFGDAEAYLKTVCNKNG